MRTIYSKISGVTFDDRQKLIKKYAKDNASLYIQPEPENKYDKNAMALYIQSGFSIFKKFHKLGYIDSELVNEGFCFQQEVKILNVTGGGFLSKKNYGVNIEITILDESDEGYCEQS